MFGKKIFKNNWEQLCGQTNFQKNVPLKLAAFTRAHEPYEENHTSTAWYTNIF